MDAPPPFDPSTVTWVHTENDLGYLTERLRDDGEATVDLETTGLNEYARDARIVMLSVTYLNDDTALVPLWHPESPWLGRWRQVMTTVASTCAEHGIGIIGHNIKFDCRWVTAHTGISLAHNIVWDTEISSHLLDENASTKLKQRAPRDFGIEPWDEDVDFENVRADSVPLFDLGLYAAQDTYWTHQLAKRHRQLLRQADPDELFTPEDVELARLGLLARQVAVPTSRTLTTMEERGIALDQDWVRSRLVENSEKMERLQDKLAHRYSALDPNAFSMAPTAHWFLHWTEEAVRAGDLRIAATTKNGNPSWSKAVMIRQSRDGSEVAGQVLDYRKYSKQNEYMRSWLAKVSRDGNIHANYRVGAVATGRLSSNGPNMQQVTKDLKPAFVPRPGRFIAEIDYSQIEMRVAAHVAQCEPMMEAFERGDDLHRLLAAHTTGKPAEKVTGDERQRAKAGNFGMLFGMSAEGFQIYAENVYDVAMTFPEAQEMHNAFFTQWRGMREWHHRTVAAAHRRGQVTSPIGRVRRLPHLYDGYEPTVQGAERQAINSPIQGMASDIMQTAAAWIAGMLPGRPAVPEVWVIGTVHDSLVLEVEDTPRWRDRLAEVIDRMRRVPELLIDLGCTFTVPLDAEATVGSRWGWDDITV